MKKITKNNLLRTAIIAVLFFSAFKTKAQQYFTDIYGSYTLQDYCHAGANVTATAVTPTPFNGMVSVGVSISPTPLGGTTTNLYFLSTDQSGAVTPVAGGCSTNGTYVLFTGAGKYCPSGANDVAMLDPTNGTVVVTGYVNNGSNTSLLAMVMDYQGNVNCVYSYDLGSGVADVIGNAIVVNGSDLYITGSVKYLSTLASGANGLDLVVLKLNYSTSGGTPTLTKLWDNILDINKFNSSTVTPWTYNEEGLDIVYNTSSIFNYGKLLVVGDAVNTGGGVMEGLAVEVNETTGAITNTSFSPSLNFCYKPNINAAQFKSVKYDYAFNTIYIGGQASTKFTGQDYLLTNVTNTGTINWATLYNSGTATSVIDDYFSSFIYTNNLGQMPQQRCYLTGYSNLGSSNNEILLFVTNNAGTLITGPPSNLLGAYHYGNTGDEEGNDISEDVNVNYVTLHSTTQNSYTPNHNIDLVNIYYNGVTQCDGTNQAYSTSSGSTSPDLVEFGTFSGLSTYIYSYNCNNYNNSVYCSATTVAGGNNGIIAMGTNTTTKSADKKISIYPTLISETNTIHIELSSNNIIKGKCEIKVMDGMGKLIKEVTVNPENKFDLNLGEHIASGVYFIQIAVDSEVYKFKVIK